MTSETDNVIATRKSLHGRSLRSKLLVPFIFILIVVGTAVTFGSIRQIDSAFTKGADERLQATHEVLFREFKKQELILQTYASFLQHFHSLSKRFGSDDEIGILQDRLYTTLESSSISVTFYPIEIITMLPQQSLIDLFEQVKHTKKPRFRYSDELGNLPVLMVAAPLFDTGKITQIMLLYTDMGASFLSKTADPLKVKASLLNTNGQVIVESSKNITDYVMSPAQIAAVARGELINASQSDLEHGLERLHISAIPLGSSDLIFLYLETSLADASKARTEIFMHLAIIIAAAMFLGLIIYFRMISNITRPVREIFDAVNEVSRGNFRHKILEHSQDELGQIALSFNAMIDSLDEIQVQRSIEEVDKALAEANSKHQALLEKKDLDIKKTLNELTTLQREVGAIYQLNQAMISSTELPQLFDRILQVINETLGSDHLVLLVYNPGDSVLEVAKTAGIDFNALRSVKFTFDQGVTGEAAQTQRLVYVKDLEKDTRNLSYHGQIVTRGSMVSAPLTVKGRLVGVLNLHKKQIEGFTGSELKLVQAVANQTAIAIDNNQLLEKARDLSTIDELTGLANRRHFQDILKREVAQARRFNSNFTIILGDIDHFKTISDKYGRMRSDAVLRQVAQTLLKNTRGIDLVCRFSTEQFVILLPKTNKSGAISAAEKLRQCIANEHYDVGSANDEKAHLTMSFGVTEFPLDSKNIYELLNLADRALYAAKNEGRDRTVAWEGPAPGPE